MMHKNKEKAQAQEEAIEVNLLGRHPSKEDFHFESITTMTTETL